MLKLAFGDETMSRTQTHDWFFMFKSGVIAVDDAERSGHPVTSKTKECVVQIKELVHENGRITICELAASTGRCVAKNDLRGGALEIGFSTTAMFLLSSLSVQEFLAKHSMTVALHPPYSQSHPATFLFFQNSSLHSRREDLITSL
jgi:hypothetical protein